jgi:hypothetical protein
MRVVPSALVLCAALAPLLGLSACDGGTSGEGEGEGTDPDIPIIVFDLGPHGNLSHALRGQPIGTLVHGE